MRGRLGGVTESIAVGDPNCVSQGRWHISLQPLSQDGAMSASCSEPANCLALLNSLARIAQGAPSCQKLPVSLIFSLPAV